MTALKELPMTPELMINELNRKLKNLYSSIKTLDKDVELEEPMKNFYKKMILAESFFNRQIISMTGLQGVGKSTIVKRMYDIPDAYLPENPGRGEKIPILITEKADWQDFTCFVRELKKEDGTNELGIQDRQITVEEFHHKAFHPGLSDVWLELHVPYKYFRNEYKSIAVLPGFEGDKETETWQEFMRHSLKMSSTFVFVLNETAAANKENKDFLQEMLIDFKEAKPIIALSYSDKSKDGNEQLRQSIMSDFRIPATQDYRVIKTGKVSTFGNEWINDLVTGIEASNSIPKVFRMNQLEHLDKQLKDLKITLDSIEEEVDIQSRKVRITRDQDIIPSLHKEYLDGFQAKRKEVTQQFEKLIKEVLNTHASNAVSLISSSISERDFNDRVKRFFTNLGNPYKHRYEFEQLIKETWSKDHVTIQTAQKINERLKLEMTLFNRNGKINSLPNGETASEYELDPVHIQNLNALFSSESSYEITAKEEMTQVFSLIPVLILESMKWSLVDHELTNASQLPEQEEAELQKKLSSIKPAPQNIIRGTVAVLGLDAVIDGQIDTIPDILNTLGIGVTKASASIAVGILGGISLAILSVNILNQMSKQSFADEHVASQLITTIRDNHFRAYTDKFNEMMDYVQVRIEHSLRKTTNVDREVFRLNQALHALNDVKDYRKEVRGAIDDYLDYLV
ncbi:hypothetical protein [Falsibacillus albus]|uniref:Uncharacterized protein n=1 Tax=Falsibacillus albus TaxID=2478915 RepID=A0A3L7JX23_9BACI|nr:hypothetical protein [Falsibacillus albus]RLQ94824.1 hypothetical protein D9X91_12600 [Falsibacillus albus]